MAFVQRLLPVFSSVVILGFFPPFEWIVLSSRIRPSYVVESVFFMIVTPGFPLDQSGCNSKNVFIFFSLTNCESLNTRCIFIICVNEHIPELNR